MQNENKIEPIAFTESILTHYVASPDDSFFVNGSPPVETIEVVSYDCSWPETYAKVALSIENALGSCVQKIDHVGSTAISGIAAKPWIDIDLTVAEPSDEESYLPALENLGFKLIVREPRFHGHRLFHHENPRVNLHVFAPNCPETARHLLFRDWLRNSPEDCQLYANAKLKAVKGCEADIAKYHENKQKVVYEIYTKIFKFLGLTGNDDVQK